MRAAGAEYNCLGLLPHQVVFPGRSDLALGADTSLPFTVSSSGAEKIVYGLQAGGI